MGRIEDWGDRGLNTGSCMRTEWGSVGRSQGYPVMPNKPMEPLWSPRKGAHLFPAPDPPPAFTELPRRLLHVPSQGRESEPKEEGSERTEEACSLPRP